MNPDALTGPVSSFLTILAVRSYIISEPAVTKGWGL